MKGTSTTTRSSGRTLQFSFSRPRRVGTYVKPPHLRRSVIGVKQALRGLAALTALQFATPAAFALPTGEVLQFGTATVARNGNVMDINQGTAKAGYNWTSFSIAAPETVNVVQPTTSSVLLNRVVGPDQSQIFGALNANGKVFLVNPNGIVFAPGAAVNVGGLVASSLNITNENFEAGGTPGNPYVFDKVPGTTGTVVNQGTITVTTVDSYAALLGPQARNEGTITAVRGTVALAAGDRVTLNILGDNLINLSVDQAAAGALALNSGSITAEGASIYLTARSADALLGTVINNSGLIRATSLTELNGRIFLDGGTGGIANSGTLDVTGSGGSLNSAGGAFHHTGAISASGASVEINHTGTVTIESGANGGSMSVTGSGIAITNAGTGFTVSAAGTQTFTAAQDSINVANSGTGPLTLQVFGGVITGGAQTFAAPQGNINITSPGTGGVRVESFGPPGVGGTQTFDTQTGAGPATTGNMTVVGSGGDVRVSSNAGVQNIKLTGTLTVGDAAAQKSTELAFNRLQDVRAAAINVIGGASNTAGAVLHSFGGQTIVTGNINITGGTAPAFGVPPIPGFISSPSAAILNNTTGTQDITADAITITGGASGSGNSAGIGNFANSAQKITADSITLTGGAAATNSNAFIQSGNNTFVGTTEVHTGALTLTGQTSGAAIGGGPGSSQDITVTGDTTLTGSGLGGSAVIGLLGTTTNATYTTKFTGTGNLTLQGGIAVANAPSAHIGAGSNHTNPTGNIDVQAANITLTAGNGSGGAFIGNSNSQPILGGGNISVTATAGDLLMRSSADGSRSAIRSVGGSISLKAARDIDAAGGRLQTGGNLTTDSGRHTTFGQTDVGGNLLATAVGAITNTQALTVTGLTSLSGGSITLGGPAAFDAGTLSFNSAGVVTITENSDTVLTGANTAGSVSLTSAGALTVDGNVTTTNGTVRLEGTSLTNNATISNGGGANTANITLRADAFDLDGTGGTGQVQGGAGAVIVTPHTNTNSLGIVSAGDTTVAQSDLNAIHTTNFVVLGSANQGFIGNTTIGENALVDGGGKSLAFFHALGPSTTTIGAQGVTTTGDIAMTAGSIVSNGGTITGNRVQLVANTGIGTSGDRVKTSANTLAVNNGGAAGGIFVSEADDVSLAAFTLNVGGNNNNQANLGGPGGYDLTAAGTITVGAGGVNSGVSNGIPSTGATTLTTTGDNHNIVLAGGNVGNLASATTLTSAGNITGTSGVVQGTAVTLDSATGIGSQVGTVITRVNTAADTLAARANSGGVFIAELDGVSLATIGGVANTTGAGGGAYDLLAGGAITVNTGGVATTNGRITLSGTALTNNDTITNGGGAPGNTNIVLIADTFNLVGDGTAAVNGGASAVVLTPRTSTNALNIESGVAGAPGTTTLTNADIATITTSNFVVFGSANLGFTGNTTIGANNPVQGGARNLAFLRATGAPGSITIGANGLTTTGDVRIAAGGGSIVGTGTIAGNRVGLSALGNIGDSINRVQTSVNSLAINAGNAAFVTEANDVSLANHTVIIGGNLNTIPNFGGGGYDFVANGAITVDGSVSSGGPGLTLTGNSLTNNASISNIGNITLNANAFDLANVGASIVSAGAVTLRPRTPTNSFGIEDAAADTSVTNADIATIQGPSVAFGSRLPGVFTGNMTIGVDAQVDGVARSLAFLRDPNTAGTITIGPNGARTGGTLIVNAGGGNIVSQGGTVEGLQVQLSATTGIGTSTNRVQTQAATLAVNNAGSAGSGAFVSEADTVTLADASVLLGPGITISTTNSGGSGAYDLLADGTITVGGNINTTGTTATGTTRLETTAGDISIGANSIGHLAAATTLVSANTITATTGVVSGQTVSLSATGDIGTTLNPILVDAGALSFNSTGAVTISEGNDTVLAGANTAGSLSLTSAGSITDAAGTSVAVTNGASLSGASINLGNSAGDTMNFGSLTFNSLGAVNISEDSATQLTGSNTAGSLTLSSAGALTDAPDTALLAINNASFSGTSITLGDSAGDVTNFGSLTFNSPGAVTISEDSATVLSGTSTAGSLALISAGSITDAAGTSVTVNNGANLTGTSINLADNASDVFSVGAGASFLATTGTLSIGNGGAASFGTLNFNAPGAVSINEAGDTTLTGANTAASLILASTGSITDAPNTSLAVTGNASLSGTSITLGDNAGDSVNLGSLTFSSTGAVSIRESSDTVLSGTNTAGSLALGSAGSITDAAGAILTVTNGASLSGTSINLGNSAGDTINFGSLTFDSPGAVLVAEDSATVLAGGSAAGNLVLSSAGSLSDTAASSLTVAGHADLSAASISLGAGSFNAGTLTFNSPGAVSISEASDTVITGTNTANSLTLTSAGAIIDAAGTSLTVINNATVTGTSITLADNAADVLDVGGTASFSGGSITIAAPGDVDFGSLTFNSLGAVVINEDCCTVLTGTNTAASLVLNSAQTITDQAGTSITVTGAASFTGTSISLADNSADVLSVGGLATFSAPGGITIGAPGTVNFGSLNFNSAGAVSISEDSATVLTGSNTAGSLALSSAGSITESGTSVEVINNASFTGTSINLVDGAGDVLSVGGNASFTATGGGAITIGASGTVNFGTLTFNTSGPVNITEDSSTSLGTSTAGSLSLTSAGAVTQTGTLTVNGAGSIDAGSNPITLTNTGNDFVGTLELKGTVTSVTDKNAFSVKLDTGETIIIANASLTSTGDLKLDGKTSGNLTATTNGGVLEWVNLTVGSAGSPKAALLVAAQPNKTITGPGSAGNALDPTTTYTKRANATGGTLTVEGGEVVLIADSLPRHPSSGDLPTIIAKTAVLDIDGLTPGRQVTIKLNGVLRLLADQGVFQFREGSVLPEGVTTLDPKKVKVFIGNSSITATTDELAARSAITAAQQSAVSNASADARQSFGTDSVTQQIDMGFAGDVGIAPTMGHSVPLQGEIISTPEGVTESKGGQ